MSDSEIEALVREALMVVLTCEACARFGEDFMRDFFMMPKAGGQAGCICPPTSEQTCQSPLCPRKPVSQKASSP